MGVMARGRRKILVNGICYIWYVGPDNDSEYHILNIVSKDKSLVISCPLKTKTPYIISKGKIFQSLKVNGAWNR